MPLGVRVSSVEEADALGASGGKGWVGRGVEIKSGKKMRLTCEKLVIATGLTSS